MKRSHFHVAHFYVGSANGADVAHDGPVLLEVMVNRQELSMPPTITADQALGFSLFAIRAVMSGKGGELIDLAKTNLLR